MSVFTSVAPETLSAWLAPLNAGKLVELKGIPTGIENTNYRVVTDKGEYALTLFERLDDEEVPFYLKLMAHLADKGVPCPRPVPDGEGRLHRELQGKPAALATWLSGKSLPEVNKRHCEQAGDTLAGMHLAAQDFTLDSRNPRGREWRDATATQLFSRLGAIEAHLLQTELAFQRDYDTLPLPTSIIHADLFRDNVLFDQGKLSGVVDFYFASRDACVYDLAIAVNDWCLRPDLSLDKDKTQALLKAYHARKPLQYIEMTVWPAMLRRAALRFWLSRLYDQHFPRPGEMTYAKDPAHFRRLLQTHIATPHQCLKV